MNWAKVRIGDFVKVVGGGTPRRSETSFYGGDIPWVTPKDMKRQRVDEAELSITASGGDCCTNR
ncbi:restriction endonuclease subunit S [Microbacterium sp.]|uniref:restriction endonuclease subunit S n=1 Tax=Microbacterium sp. TaxID=51671 RepID=UPI0037C5B0B3